MNSKRIVFICMLGVASLTLTIGCAGSPKNEIPEKPKIIEVFACSDYCPGPEKKYLKMVYEGVTDEEECLSLGGKPYTYIGWGSFFVCIVR